MKTLVYVIVISAIVIVTTTGAGIAGCLLAPPIPKEVPPPPGARRPMNCAYGIVMTQNEKDIFWAKCVVVVFTLGSMTGGFAVGCVLGAAVPFVVRLDSTPPSS